jgi:phospholipid transport system transporter-binding protein
VTDAPKKARRKAVSEMKFENLGEGKFSISGPLTFDTVARALVMSKNAFENFSVLEVDLSGVTETDSAGLALLLEWVNWAKYFVREIHYKSIPKQILAIAEISEVDDMLRAGERWTGQNA